MKIAKDACYSPKNKFTETVWDYHILPVVDHSINLGKRLKADLEILELSALLHDHACLVDKKLYESHHAHSADMAEKILIKLDCPRDKINHIKECILSHRGSVKKRKKSLEAKILASADAMSHITELADMFYLTYGVHEYKTREGAEWLKDKIQRSWDKVISEGKKMIKNDYKLIMGIINQALNKQPRG